MAVSTIKAGWSKFSARIRDYIDVVDSYYRPSDDLQVPSSHTQCQTNKTKSSKQNKSCDRSYRKHATSGKSNLDRRCNHHNSRSNSSSDHRGALTTKSPSSSNQHCHSQRPLAHSNHNHHPNCLLDLHANKVTKSQLPHGYCKRKTPQGQVYFVDLNGQKTWYDPCVPKELLTAQLNLDRLVGKLSSTWEVRRTPTGKTYFVNHTKKTTQFTDPRLVVYKDQLLELVRTHAALQQSNANDRTPSQRPILSNTSPANVQQEHISPSPNQQFGSNLRLAPVANRFSSLQRISRVQSTECPRHHVPWSLRSTIMETSASSPTDKLSGPNSQQTAHSTSISNNNRSRNNDTPSHVSPMRSSQLNLLQVTRQHSVERGGHSNTLTGPLPGWWRAVISKPKPSAAPPPVLDRNLSPTRQSPNFKRQTNNYENTRNNNSQVGASLTQHHDFHPAIYNTDGHAIYQCPTVDNSKELSEKITLLRQELIKQQVLSHPCRIDINRKRIFEESYRVVSQLKPRDLKKRLLVKFRGEEGLDYGGVAREWFYLLSREILNPSHGLFQYTSDDIYNLQINPDSGIVYREHLTYLNFCGRIMGMAVFHGHFIEGHFTLPFYKMLLRKPISLKDIENVDPELHRSLCWILENDITNVIDTTFLVQHNAFGQLQEHELKVGGRNIAVTEENKLEYVTLYVNYRCRRGIESQFEALQRGFYELIAPHLLENFDERELELLIGGLSKINIEDWRQNTKLKNCTTETSLVIWFWDIVKSYSEEKRAQLLQFVTGSPRVPIQGFKALQGVNSELRLFTIHLIKNACTDNLPKSHTCFNRIDLPPYESYDKLRDKLTQAIEETMGFAMQ